MPTLTPFLLRQALVQHSPRYRGARSSWRAVLIQLMLLGLWAGLLHEAWVQRSAVMAWSLDLAPFAQARAPSSGEHIHWRSRTPHAGRDRGLAQ
jgi:hypothetical protein